MKTAFNIKFRPEIEAGKFKVVTADGRPVTIQRWDMKGNYPILACTMVKQCNWEGDESWDEERPFAYDKDGHAAGTAPADKLELFLISEDPELTEFEYAVQEIFYKGRETDIDLLKITSGTLLKVARKQLTEELPHWRKCEVDPRFPGVIRSYVGYWEYMGYEINLEEVFNKLPKED